jgi:hypothetical protein
MLQSMRQFAAAQRWLQREEHDKMHVPLPAHS